MAETHITWLGDGKKFVGVDSTNHGVVISSVDDGIGAKPSELMLMALGSCTAYDVVNILTKKRQPLTALDVHVTAVQKEDPPWTFQSFHVHYVFKGRGLSVKAVEDAIELSDTKYCSVSTTLKLAVPVTHDYEIIEESD